MATRLLTIIGEPNETFRKPDLEIELYTYTHDWNFPCFKCSKEKNFSINTTLLQKVYCMDFDKSKTSVTELVVLKLENQLKIRPELSNSSIVQCKDCNCIYQLVNPDPIYRREFEVSRYIPIFQIPLTYNTNRDQAIKDIQRSVNQIEIIRIGIPNRF